MLGLAAWTALLAQLSAAPTIDFVRDIQPIFAQHCYTCHGPNRQEAEFRLDHKPTALKGGDLGPAILPGKGADSLLVRAISGQDAKLKMPRKSEPLTSEQIGKIRTWIDEGALWPDSASVQLDAKKDHWAFKAPVKPPVPLVQGSSGPLAPIDAFVQTRLQKEGLAPSPEADRPTLIRRAYLDLVGLPPSPAEVDAFVHDASPDAYKKVVDHLLSSPRYGERWGRHWLDAARYADSNGYEKDPMRYIWFYRDWVINAFNRDLPYNEFIIEQIAGDELPHATQDQVVATGFLRNSMVNEEGGVDPEQFRMEAMFDRMDAIGKSILGLTLNCCQCHNHKYDPITQEEYYKIFAFLNNDNEPWRVVYSSSERQLLVTQHRRIVELEEQLQKDQPDWAQRMAAWEAGAKYDEAQWRTLQAPFIDDTTGGEKFLLQPDGSYLAQSYAPTKSEPKMKIHVDAENITAFRLELLNDPNLPAYGPGRAQNGTCALSEFHVEVESEGKTEKLKFASATADFGEAPNTPLVAFARDKDSAKDQRITGPVSYAIDGDDKTAWGIDAGPGQRNQPRNAVFVLDKPTAVHGDVTIGLAMKHGGWNSDDLQNMDLGRFRISYSTANSPVADMVPKRVRQVLKVPTDKRTPAQVAAIFSYWRTTVPEWQAVNDQIAALWKEHPEGSTTLVLDARKQPRMTSILKRGDFLKPAERVQAGVPAILNPLPPHADGSRLTFAKWLVDPKSPTTARAFVNRVWQAYFGTGLVATPEDFGTQGEAPSHPQLLDWLASEFMARGWSVKELHRMIVMSQTYRQSSQVTPAMLERDPYNRLLAHGPRFRVEGEVVRDLQLAVSGLLNLKVGGRSVMPPAPDYLFEKPISYAPFPWKVEDGASKYRRAVYTFRRRSTPYPFLSTFDVPNGETSCVRRVKSDTPLQALMTLNETVSMDAARGLATRMMREGGDSASSRLTYGFRLCTSRAPTAKELGLLEGLLERQRQAAQQNPQEAADLLATTAASPSPDAPNEAAYTLVARALLNMDETITKE